MGDVATSEFRIGLGEDRHRLSEPSQGDGGPLRLGGVAIPHDRHLVGHSDADVLLHAITDALLGALALHDIGQLFPNDQEENRDRDSAEMLAAAAARMTDAGYRIVNLDCVLLAQRPRIADYKEAIRQRIASLLEIAPEQVGLKAKTGEFVGAIGREDAIDARCVALLARSE